MQPLQLHQPHPRLGTGTRPMPRIAVMLVAVLTRLLSAQTFPEDRSLCPTDDIACMVGEVEFATDFPLRVTNYVAPDRGFTGTSVAAAIAAGDITYLLPEGYVIDFTGNLATESARYVAPSRYVGDSGATYYPGMTATVIVNDTHFDPAEIDILPGTTVTWDLQTFETIDVRSNDGGNTFASGPINRNWGSTYTVVFDELGEHPYRNVEEPEWTGAFNGRVKVSPYNCSVYSSCTTCLLYERCLWCPNNNTRGSCHERNMTTNIPLGPGPVVAVEPQPEYSAMRYMFGYNTRTAAFQFDWYPWPAFRRSPKPVPARFIPTYFDPIASDACPTGFQVTTPRRDAAQCDDAVVDGPRERVHAVETQNRPSLEDFFTCYEHVSQTWARPDVPDPTPWTEWPTVNYTTDTLQLEGGDKDDDMDASVCCDLCSSCGASLLAACNVTCPLSYDWEETEGEVKRRRRELEEMNETSLDSLSWCPWGADRLVAVHAMCGQHMNLSHCEATEPTNASRCERFLVAMSEELEATATGMMNGGADMMGMNGGDDAYKRRRSLEAEDDDADPLDTTFTAFAPIAKKPTNGSSSGLSEASEAARRRMQFGFGPVDVSTLTPWEQVPQQQKSLMGRVMANTNLWVALATALEDLFGPRCNVTHGCDRHDNPPKGRCLNISGLPIYAYDQNGTCVCHPWYTGADCSEVVVNEETCKGMPNDPKCRQIRGSLFGCGPVLENDYLPDECQKLGLTVVECGEAGFMHGQRNESGISNLVGRPDSGYAAIACSKCLARGEMRSETFAKLCDRSVVLRACQRYEDATAQRLCNYCTGDTQGSVRPQRGIDRSCSYFRGTCMGSVEKRIRGIVPPNADIVGQTAYGGLRYCREPSTFTSIRHYYTEADIMQVGQTCRGGTTPVFEGWDWTRLRDAPQTRLDEDGTRCAEPDNEATCPRARFCVDAELCYTDTPDWQDMSELVRHMGLNRLRQFADDPLCNTYYGTDAAAAQIAGTTITIDGGVAGAVVECTFERHMLQLRPSTAADTANWPFLSQDYMDGYTRVSWSTEVYRPPPPPPKPPPPEGFGFLGRRLEGEDAPA